VTKPRPRRWIVAIVVVWSVALLGLGAWGVLNSSVTDREETTVAAAVPTVDRAVNDVVAASTVDGQAVVYLSDLKSEGPCKVTAFRSGGRYQRVVTALVQPGNEEALLQRVAARLPRSYNAELSHRKPLTMTADAGFFVGVNGATVGQGVVQFVVDTGSCRSTGDIPVSPTSASPSQSVSVRDVLTRLGASPLSIRRYAVPCPNGGELSTVEAFTDANPGTPPEAKLSSVPAATPVVTTDTLYAYTVARSQIAVRTVKGGVDVTETVLCGQQ
jgi:hypothetical protein